MASGKNKERVPRIKFCVLVLVACYVLVLLVMIVIVLGFHFHFVCILRRVLYSLVCVLLCLVLSWRTRHWPGHVSVAGHPHTGKKTGQAINRFDILHLVSMGAQPGPQPQDLRHHRASAAPHFSHTIYLHTTLSARSSTYTIRRQSSSTAASATQLKPALSRITGHAEVSVSPA
jgi:hypothetical protein